MTTKHTQQCIAPHASTLPHSTPGSRRSRSNALFMPAQQLPSKSCLTPQKHGEINKNALCPYCAARSSLNSNAPSCHNDNCTKQDYALCRSPHTRERGKDVSSRPTHMPTHAEAHQIHIVPSSLSSPPPAPPRPWDLQSIMSNPISYSQIVNLKNHPPLAFFCEKTTSSLYGALLAGSPLYISTSGPATYSLRNTQEKVIMRRFSPSRSLRLPVYGRGGRYRSGQLTPQHAA